MVVCRNYTKSIKSVLKKIYKLHVLRHVCKNVCKITLKYIRLASFLTKKNSEGATVAPKPSLTSWIIRIVSLPNPGLICSSTWIVVVVRLQHDDED